MELGDKTSKLLFLEQYMKDEAIRKANLVKVNKSTCTQPESEIQEGKTELDSRERIPLERVRKAEIQVRVYEGPNL